MRKHKPERYILHNNYSNRPIYFNVTENFANNNIALIYLVSSNPHQTSNLQNLNDT